VFVVSFLVKEFVVVEERRKSRCIPNMKISSASSSSSFSILSDDRSKTMPPYSAIQSLLLQMRVSSPVLKVIQ